LEQNKTNFALTPKIAWMIRIKDTLQYDLKSGLKENARQGFRVKKIPPAIFELNEVEVLNITFIDEIIIPYELSNVKIGKLILNGKITKAEQEKIIKMFPNIEIIINGKSVGKNADEQRSSGIDNLRLIKVNSYY
jgi:hypothetical protein